MPARIVERPELRDSTLIFMDRLEAGKYLAGELKEYAGKSDVIVLAIPAGGVPVGCEIAKALDVLMDVIVARKVQIPWSPEAGFGAVAWDGKFIINQDLAEQLQLTEEDQAEAISETKKGVEERLKKFRGDRRLPNLVDKTVILVDDGLASGYTMLVAVRSVQEKAAKNIVIAVPTASLGAVELLSPEVYEIVCPNIRSGLSFAVADAYRNWYDLTDDDVLALIGQK